MAHEEPTELRLVASMYEDQDAAIADEMQPSPSVSLSPLASSTPSSPLPIPSSPNSPSSMSPLPPPPQAQPVRRSAQRQRRCVPCTQKTHNLMRKKRRRSFADAVRVLDQSGGESSGTTIFGVAWTIVLPHVCACAFLVLLALRLERINVSWRVIFAPLWIGDLVTISRRMDEFVQALSARRDVTEEEQRKTSILRPIANGIDAVAIFATKILLALQLEASIDWEVLMLLGPFWIGMVCSNIARGALAVQRVRQRRSSENQEDHQPTQREFHVLQDFCTGVVAAGGHACSRGLQPALVALKLDDYWDASSWGVVFAPAWIVLAILASVAATLCNCTPLLSAGMPNRVRRQAIRLVSLCTSQLIAIAGCTFVSAFLLAKRLDAREAADARYRRRRDKCAHIMETISTEHLAQSQAEPCTSPGYLDRDLRSLEPSATAILAPLILMYGVIFVIHPLVVRDSRYFQQIVRVVVIEADDSRDEARAALAAQRANVLDILSAGASQTLVGVQDNNIIVNALTMPTKLLRHSGTLYQRASPVSSLAADHQDIENAKAASHGNTCAQKRDNVAACDKGVEEDWSDDSSFRSVDANEQPPKRRVSGSHKLCYVCCIERRNAVLFECGHGGLCFGCAHSLATRHPRTCPICRQQIDAVLKVGRRQKGSNFVVSEEGIIIRPTNSTRLLDNDAFAPALAAPASNE